MTSVRDEKKGERIAVLHTLSEDQINSVLEQLSKAELPPLWKPNQFFFIEALPYIGTGKLDLRALKTLAEREQTVGIAR